MHLAFAKLTNFLQKGQPHDAVSLFQRAFRVSQQQGNPNLKYLNNAGVATTETGDLDAALNVFHEVLQTDPKYVPMMIPRGGGEG